MNILLTKKVFDEKHLNILRKLDINLEVLENETSIVKFDYTDVDGIICNSFFIYNDICKFSRLKYIQLLSAGYDRVPMQYIQSNNIIINNLCDVYNIPIVEHIVLKILEIYRNNRIFEENQKKRLWSKDRSLMELNNKKVLILGLGNIGKRLADVLKVFGCDVYGYSRSTKKYKDVFCVNEYSELLEILELIDVVVVCLSLSKETENFLNYDNMKLLKKNSVLINVARGRVINQKDLVNLIMRGYFKGVALDVFCDEPLDERSVLWNFDNVYITPHNAFIGDNNEERMFNVVFNNLKEFLNSSLCLDDIL